ncbi:hypothetical protein [Anaerotignum sp.]|uniref:hypothetical protein n=1 Tax=Anaerotignum sp. TaxID=2039241 RepID=UPI0028B064BE|nr:hypothetical protein [Anaerotignum sp.]
MFYCAQIDTQNICVCISQLAGKIDVGNMIPIDSMDGDLIGKRYNKGIWEDVLQPEPIPLPLSPTEQAILQTAINTEYMMSLMEVKG